MTAAGRAELASHLDRLEAAPVPGWQANATLIASFGADVVDTAQRVEDFRIRTRSDMAVSTWRAAVRRAGERLCLPAVDERALAGLRFSDALPRHLAEATLSWRLADLEGARQAHTEPHRLISN